jgi:hypothetical protein
MEIFMKKYKQILALGTMVFLPISAYAADEGAAAINTIKGIPTECGPYGYAMVAACAGIVVFKFLRRIVS